MSQSAVAFHDIATKYCNYVETASKTPLGDLLHDLSLLLAQLYIAAMSLPDTQPTNRDSDVSVKLPSIQFYAVDGYWEVFDPYEEAEPLMASLMDDVTDIYRDVNEGLLIYERGTEEDIADAVWHWKFHFQAHWGYHLVDALRAMHWAMSRE